MPRRAHSLVLGCLLALTQASIAGTPKIISFDPPGSVNTVVWGINQAGTVAGYFGDAEGNFHGFTRNSAGQFTIIDIAGPTSRTTIYSINDEGTVAGDYYSGDYLGFILDRFGNVTSFNPGGAPFPTSINTAGELAGIEIGGSDGYGFTRDLAGNTTIFVPPNGLSVPSAYIDSYGRIAGTYTDSKIAYHGYVRDPSGNFTTFDAPDGGTFAGQGTLVYALLATGLVTIGSSTDQLGVGHGFTRQESGTFSIFDVPTAGTKSGEGTFAICGNLDGTVAGSYVDSAQVSHGFIRDPLGNITTFDDKNAGRGKNEGTVPQAINASGQIAGTYFDSHGVQHGFLRLSQ